MSEMGPQLGLPSAAPDEIFNSQQFQFGRFAPVDQAPPEPARTDFYQEGWTVFDDVADPRTALAVQESFIAGLDGWRLPFHRLLDSRVELAKADQIPVCSDVLPDAYQVHHFDMGHPLTQQPNQPLIAYVGLYLPADSSPVTARTRLLDLWGLVRHFGLYPWEAADRLEAYAAAHGDGWIDAAGTYHNTGRLACLARVIDALSGRHELADIIDRPVGQWFSPERSLDEFEAHGLETAFYLQHGINMPTSEVEVTLEPGQLLIIDNVRIAHGRIGQRQERELYSFMWGLPEATPADISAVRTCISELLCCPCT